MLFIPFLRRIRLICHRIIEWFAYFFIYGRFRIKNCDERCAWSKKGHLMQKKRNNALSRIFLYFHRTICSIHPRIRILHGTTSLLLVFSSQPAAREMGMKNAFRCDLAVALHLSTRSQFSHIYIPVTLSKRLAARSVFHRGFYPQKTETAVVRV